MYIASVRVEFFHRFFKPPDEKGVLLAKKLTKMINKLTTARKVEFYLKDQGRKKTWLSEQLGVSRPTLDKKLRDNSFSDDEIARLKLIFNW